MAIDLDAARAARQEALKDSPRPQVVFGGETFDLPHELPLAVLLRMGEMRKTSEAAKKGQDVDPEKAARALEVMHSIAHDIFGDDTDRFLDARPTIDDFNALLEALFDSYELDMGEASASPSQS